VRHLKGNVPRGGKVDTALLLFYEWLQQVQKTAEISAKSYADKEKKSYEEMTMKSQTQ
jgi:hypothetical protein